MQFVNRFDYKQVLNEINLLQLCQKLNQFQKQIQNIPEEIEEIEQIMNKIKTIGGKQKTLTPVILFNKGCQLDSTDSLLIEIMNREAEMLLEE